MKNNNKPSSKVSRLPTVFLTKELSKYRFKPPKCRVPAPLKSQKRSKNEFTQRNH